MSKPTRKPHARKPGILVCVALLFILSAAFKGVSGVTTARAQDATHTNFADHGTPESSLAGPPQMSPRSTATLALQVFEREQNLASREAEIDARLAHLAEEEARLQAQIQTLHDAEAALASTMALADRASEDDIQRLVAVYEAMRAEDAAKVFAEMEPDFAAGLIARLQPGNAAQILAGLPAGQAYALSVIIAGRNALVPRQGS